jgi:hypothetical protein
MLYFNITNFSRKKSSLVNTYITTLSIHFIHAYIAKISG